MYMYVWPHVLLCRIKQLHVCTEFKFILYLIICTGTILYNYRYNLFIYKLLSRCNTCATCTCAIACAGTSTNITIKRIFGIIMTKKRNKVSHLIVIVARIVVRHDVPFLLFWIPPCT